MTPQAKSIKLFQTLYLQWENKKTGITVTDGQGTALKKGKDYTLSYPNKAKEPGRYKVIVRFQGNYSGTAAVSFTIRPKGVAISKLTGKGSGFTVKWKKQKHALSGYEISYSTSRKFTKKTARSVTSGKSSAVSKSVSKLKAKQKYYVRIRAFCAVKENGKSKRIYSAWSKPKTVTTKR